MKIRFRFLFFSPAIMMLMTSCATVNIFRHTPLKIAASLEKQGDIDSAVKILEDASSTPKVKPKDKIEFLVALSDLYEKKKDTLNAINALKKAKGLGGKSGVVRLRLADLYLKVKLYDEALLEYSVVEETGLETPSLYRGLAEVYSHKGQMLSAAKYFKKYLKIYPDDKKALYGLYGAYEAMGKYPEARNVLAGCSSIMEEKDFILSLAMNWMRDGNPAEAVDELEKIKSKYPEAMFYLGLAYYQKGDLDKALQNFSEPAGECSHASVFFRAMILYETGNKKEASKLFSGLSGKEDLADYCAVFLD